MSSYDLRFHAESLSSQDIRNRLHDLTALAAPEEHNITGAGGSYLNKESSHYLVHYDSACPLFSGEKKN